MQNLVIFAAPSGSGKTSIVRALLADSQQLSFSISATTRAARGNETDGVDYFFLSVETFQNLIQEDAFIEWEMVYEGKYYGTLWREIENIEKSGKIPLLDIDVVGATNLKEKYPEQVFAVFIQAPSLEMLEERLTARGTDSKEVIAERLAKAAFESGFADRFDAIIVNDDLQVAIQQAKDLLQAKFPEKKLFLS